MVEAPGPFPFDYVRMDVATFALPNLTYQGTQAAPIPTAGALPSYGQALTVADDGGTPYVYAYGHTSTGGGLGTIVHQYVGRVPLGQVLTGSAWQVWDGAGWSSDPGTAAPLAFDRDATDATPPEPDAGPEAQLAVSSTGGVLLGSALSFDVISDALETWDAAAPQGPWTLRALAVDIWPVPPPEGEFGYGGRVVLDLLGSPLALWSINNGDLDAVIADLDLYKARFATPARASVP